MAEHEFTRSLFTTPEGKVYNHRSYSVSADDRAESPYCIMLQSCASFKNRGSSSSDS